MRCNSQQQNLGVLLTQWPIFGVSTTCRKHDLWRRVQEEERRWIPQTEMQVLARPAAVKTGLERT